MRLFPLMPVDAAPPLFFGWHLEQHTFAAWAARQVASLAYFIYRPEPSTHCAIAKARVWRISTLNAVLKLLRELVQIFLWRVGIEVPRQFQALLVETVLLPHHSPSARWLLRFVLRFFRRDLLQPVCQPANGRHISQVQRRQ